MNYMGERVQFGKNCTSGVIFMLPCYFFPNDTPIPAISYAQSEKLANFPGLQNLNTTPTYIRMYVAFFFFFYLALFFFGVP